ncbi:MAG: CapA family protein, partial [Lachnospiraceae bacterium]|nr:CapA family protein [Lachnospiraceae bacterium]
MKERSTLAFTGDIGFDKYMSGRYSDEKLVDVRLLDFLRSADHVVANVEGPLSRLERQVPQNGVASMMHSMDPEVSGFLKSIKADIWNICNNHIMDAGPNGVRDTLDEAQKNGALTLGAGMNLSEAMRPVIIPEAGGIGLIGVGYRRGCKPAADDYPGCFLWNETELIRKAIENVKNTCRWCIIVSHGGEEFTSLPSPYTRDRYISFLEMGADAVVSHHPHVPMNYETFPDGKAIFYSLGNFVFDTDYQRVQFNTEKGVLLKLFFTKESFSFEATGLLIDRNTERVLYAELPDIFTNVQADEYERLAPLSAKAFIAATKRQQIFMNPAKFKDFTEHDWNMHFDEEKRSGRVPREALDFRIIVPFSKKAETGEWKNSS